MNKLTIFVLLNLMISVYADENEDNNPYPDGNPDNQNPGISACQYFGDTMDSDCKELPMYANSLPVECTSFFYDGLQVSFVNNSVEITNRYDYIDAFSLEDLIKTEKNVYLYHGHLTVEEWIKSLDVPKKQATDEMNYLKQNLDSYPDIKGLVLYNIVVNVGTVVTLQTCYLKCIFLKTIIDYENNVQDTIFPDTFTCNLIEYINTMKQIKSGLQIALRLSAISILTHVDNNCKDWLDFQALNEAVDFYTVDFTDFNACKEEFIHTGIIPMDGPGNTLNKFLKAFKNLNLPKEKMYYEFLISPTFPAFKENKHYPCFIRYTKICENDEPDIDKWCADTTSSLREKGKFANENGAGFIAKSIDTSDRNKKCDCYDNKYPTFFFMLDGWYDVRQDKKCPKIDRIFT